MPLILRNRIIDTAVSLHDYFCLEEILSAQQRQDFLALIHNMYFTGKGSRQGEEQTAYLRKRLAAICAGELPLDSACTLLTNADSPLHEFAKAIDSLVNEAGLEAEDAQTAYCVILCAYYFGDRLDSVAAFTGQERNSVINAIRNSFLHKREPEAPRLSFDGAKIDFEEADGEIALEASDIPYVLPLLSFDPNQGEEDRIRTIKIVKKGGEQLNPVKLSFAADGKELAHLQLRHNEYIYVNVWKGRVVKYLPNISASDRYCAFRRSFTDAAITVRSVRTGVDDELAQRDADGISLFAIADDGGMCVLKNNAFVFMTQCSFSGLRWDSEFIQRRIVDAYINGSHFALLDEHGQVFSNISELSTWDSIVALIPSEDGTLVGIDQKGESRSLNGQTRRSAAEQIVFCLKTDLLINANDHLLASEERLDIREFSVSAGRVWIKQFANERAAPLEYRVTTIKDDGRIVCEQPKPKGDLHEQN